MKTSWSLVALLWLSACQSPPQVPAPVVAQAERYQCPMHHDMVSDAPGTCPICNMKLVKVEASPKTPLEGVSSEVEGLGLVTLEPARQQLMGLKTAQVDVGPLGTVLRTNARVAVDETRVRRVNVKVAGFVEHLFVDFVGKPVRKGEPLYSLFSTEVLAAENELLLALRSNEPALIAASRSKLVQWAVPDTELQRLEREKLASSTVTFLSNVTGVVTTKDVVEGSRLEVGAMPFEVVDLSSVWVLADVYETELRFITPGQMASLRLDAWPGRTWQGKVLFVDPSLDPKTRTAKVRLSFANAKGELKPEMFGEVTLAREPREVLRVPADAVVQSGTQQVVFVSRGEGRFEPRRIETGEQGHDSFEVLSGLSVGDAVVTRANFLVDSESRLRASLAHVGGGEAKR